MRILIVFATLGASGAWAQHAAHTASTQAMQAASQATYTANRSAAQAQQNASAFQQMQYRVQNQQCSTCPKAPKFSVETGEFYSPLSLEITDATQGAVIYYTTDGKKPTKDSTRYTGSITLTASAELRAIAVSDGGSSRVTSAVYTVEQRQK